MTYQEIKDRLSKCELTLEKLKNGSYNSTDVKQKTEKLEILRESYVKLLKEAEKTAFINGNPVEYEKEDELKKYKDNSDVKSIKTAQGKDIKEQDGTKFSVNETKSIARRVGKAVAQALKSLGDEVARMKAKNIEENSFEIYVQYKNDAEDEFSFYIVDDTLHLTDFSFDKELTDVGVKPSGEAVVNVDVLANELIKHFRAANEMKNPGYASSSQSNQYAQRGGVKLSKQGKEDLKQRMKDFAQRLKDKGIAEAPEGMYYIKIPKDAASQNKAQVIFNDLHGINYEINDDPKGIVMYFKKEDFDAGVIDDLEGDGVQILDTNVPMNEEDVKQIEAPEAQGDLDVGHQDDEPNMLKKDLYDVITYASKLYKALDKYDQHDGEVDFPHWWQKKVTLAREYMSAAQHYLEGEEKQPAIDQLALEGIQSENRFLAASMEDLEQVIRNLAHTGEMSEDEAIEMAIRKLEAMLDGRDDMDENLKEELGDGTFDEKMSNLTKAASIMNSYVKEFGGEKEQRMFRKIYMDLDDFEVLMAYGRDDMDEGRKDNDALYPDNPRLPEIKKLADKIVSMVKAEAAKGELGYIRTMEEIRYQQEDDFERTPEWNKAKGIRPDFDDYGSGTNEGIGKTKKALDLVITKMKELAKQYKAGDKSVIDDLKYYTAKKKSLEAMLDRDVSGKNRGQELAEYRGVENDIRNIIRDKAADSGFDEQEEAMEVMEFIGQEYDIDFEFGAGPSRQESINEQATCCGKCGRVHVKGTKCKRPYLKGKDHCRNN